MTGKTTVLISATNLTGYKLEELAVLLIADMEVKCERLQSDPSQPAQDVLRNNRDIITRLREIKRLQDANMAVLLAVGPDQGPSGKPRVGAGS